MAVPYACILRYNHSIIPADSPKVDGSRSVLYRESIGLSKHIREMPLVEAMPGVRP